MLHWVFLAVVFLSVGLWYQHADTRPNVPNSKTGNVYALNTHGSRAYLTFQDWVRLYATMGVGFGGLVTIRILVLWPGASRRAQQPVPSSQ
jgi:hypothetical protein